MNDTFYLHKGLQLIEEKLQWGDSKDWVHADFIRLSEKVTAASRISISAHTLKRLFGKIRYKEEYNPQYDTKKALAIFLGYSDWEDFVIDCKQTAAVATADLAAVHAAGFTPDASPRPHAPGPMAVAPELHPDDTHAWSPVSETPPIAPAPVTPKVSRVRSFLREQRVLLGAFALTLLGLAGFFLYQSCQEPVISFRGKNLLGKAPLTAVFHYELSRVSTDSVFTFFEGNREKRFLPRTRNTTTQYYEYPGFYQVQLMVGNKVASTTGVHVLSEGWKGIIVTADDSIYYHLATANIAKGGRLEASPMEVKASGVDTTDRYWTVYCNAREFKASGDDFLLDTRVKSNVKKEHMLCKDFGIRIIGETGKIRIHLVQPGCTRWARLTVGDVHVEGGFTDLSALGQDLTGWRRVQLAVKEGQARILVDGKPVYTLPYDRKIGAMKSIELEFLGVGAVDYVKLYNARQELVYADDFEALVQ